MVESQKDILKKFNESTLEQQIKLDEKYHFEEIFTRDEIIKGCLKVEESSLLFKIFDLMERELMGGDYEFKYDWVITMSSEDCWKKREENWRFFEILKGHVSSLEYDIFWNNYELLYQLPKFKELDHLMLHIYGAFPDLEDLKIDTINTLSIDFKGPSESVLEKIIKLFPNLTYISISDGKDIKEWSVLKNVKKLQHLVLVRTYMAADIKKELLEKGIKIM